MSSIAAPTSLPGEEPIEQKNYLNVKTTLSSWLLTGDHKRIAVLYLFSIFFFFILGSIAAGLVRYELTSPTGRIMESETYNKVFSAHGIIMIFFFLIPSIPATFGNFFLPIMVGARDLAFPRLNLASWYVYVVAGILMLTSLCLGGVDTGWTFYPPYSSMYANSQVTLTILAAFLAGFSSIMTGMNFIVTVHKMRAPGMTWFRLPLFVWAHYATAIIMILGTPVVAITLSLVLVERVLRIGIFSPELGGDPVLFQHLFWFYSHPAVYIMVLPGMGVVSELIANFSRKRIFGYEFVAFSSLAIAALGFVVWGHHMFISTQSMYQGIFFSLLSFLVAVPSAIKVFNWTATMYKGHVVLAAPMLYALGFIGLFTIGGLTGLFLSSMGTNIHLTNTYFVVAHFHYVMVGGAMMAFLGGLHYWWPKMFGRMYADNWAQVTALLSFVGFNLTFMPQFIIGWMGMPRRYHYYYFAPEFQAYHIASSLGASVLAVSLILPVFYLGHSLKYGPKAPPNPWGAHGLEWQTDSPPITSNFESIPIVTDEVYDFPEERTEPDTHLAAAATGNGKAKKGGS
ncbi:MAG: cbb3-type cytochrome c oxidase subunit I [Fimbriimonas ginsengisoli]|uniref:Cbb3-type cytochrome c oxidase subunit I n=1 Tax=Fimbriimonas ginsengisoli TaxID=1005039 RepID=A0A931M0R0_FIMGI|nr:cbb3-type cytochrome c oxidase subunit I [Fimbriimonas ginsengisoli]